jgi:probable HAF family extracellular repeat protein
MNRAYLLLPLAAIGGACVLHSHRARRVSQPRYSIRDLGTLGGRTSMAVRLNQDGQVVGSAETARGVRHAFLDANGKMIDLTPDGPSSAAGGINDSGCVVLSLGVESLDAPRRAPPYRSNGPPVELVSLAGIRARAALERERVTGGRDRGADPHAINIVGQIVGTTCSAGRGLPHACVWENGARADLGDFGGGSSNAWDVNGSGQVVGYAQTSDRSQHAFLYREGRLRDLGTLGGGNSCAYGISDSGLIVGEAETSGPSVDHAFVVIDGRMCDLGVLDDHPRSVAGSRPESSARGVNSLGEVVGEAWTSLGRRAFLWSRERGMRDLNALIPIGCGWTLQQASAINDRGQIAGWGMHGGDTRAFLLTPWRAITRR